MTGLTRNVSRGTAAGGDGAQLTVFCLVIMTKTGQFVDRIGHIGKSMRQS